MTVQCLQNSRDSYTLIGKLNNNNITTIIIIVTKLLFNLRQITRECVHFVRRGHFRYMGSPSHHSIAVSQNPLLHANFMARFSIKPDLLPIKFLHCQNRKFSTFCSCDLDIDLDQMIFIYELDP